MFSDPNRKYFIAGVATSLIGNIIFSFIIYLISDYIKSFLNWDIPTWLLLSFSIAVSLFIVIEVIRRKHNDIRSRIYMIRFLVEDSATQAFDHFIETIKKIMEGLSRKINTNFEKDVLGAISALISLRRQPMQIIEEDCKKLIKINKKFSSVIPIEKQFRYYLDFLKAFKLNALPRIIRHSDLYFETFLKDEFNDYVITYGHSTNVVKAIISCYKKYEFPIIIVEDLQYKEHSLKEHLIVASNFEDSKIDFHLIGFSQLQELFDPKITHIVDVNGKNLTLTHSRRFHTLIGAERINQKGDTLVPSRRKGKPSETGHFIEMVRRFSQEQENSGNTLARIIIVSESYKVRDYDGDKDLKTNVPLKEKGFDKILFVLGVKKNLPPLYQVDLFEIKSENIYLHINELGIFPNFDGKFDLSFCANVFESETSLIGFFNEPQTLVYRFFDEVKAVAFDLNGVIINDENIHYEAFKKTFVNFGISLTLDQYNKLCKGRNDHQGILNIITQLLDNSKGIDVESLKQKKSDNYLEIITKKGVNTFPGVIRTLKELRIRGYTLVLVTASKYNEVELILAKTKLFDYFDDLITDDEVEISKPHCEAYRLAAERLKIDPSKIIVVEDSSESIKSAKMLGMRTIAIKHDEDDYSIADHTIKQFDELLTI